MKGLLSLLLKPLRIFLKLSFKKKLLVIFLLIVIVIIAGVVWQNLNKKSKYVMDRAKLTSLTEVVSESGTIEADGKIDVMSPTNGIITKIYVQNGQRVAAGEKLFEVKSSANEQEQQAALTNYLAAQSSLNSEEAALYTLRSSMYTEWKSFRDLATSSDYETGEGVARKQEREAAEFQTSQDDWLAAEKNYKDQQTAVSAARAKVSSTYLAYQSTKDAVVKAPVAGIVKNVAVSKENSVSASTALVKAPAVLSIVNSDKIGVLVKIGQTDISKVKTGQEVNLLPDAYKDAEYKGRVVRRDDIGDDSSGVVTYNTYIEFTNADEKLRPGMTIDAEIVTKSLRDVLTVPNSAIVPYNGGKAVRIVKENDDIEYIPVKIGSRGDSRTQILSGIREGQNIIVSITSEALKGSGLLGL